MTLNTTLSGILYHTYTILPSINQHTTYYQKFYKMGRVTSTTPIRGYFVTPSLTLDTFYLGTKFRDSYFSRSGDMIAGVEIENWSCDPDHAPFRGALSSESRT